MRTAARIAVIAAAWMVWVAAGFQVASEGPAALGIVPVSFDAGPVPELRCEQIT